jgi:hypothetical protein
MEKNNFFILTLIYVMKLAINQFTSVTDFGFNWFARLNPEIWCEFIRKERCLARCFYAENTD